MQRDMNLFREILVQCEQHTHGFAPSKITIEHSTDEQIGFHIYLLGRAGLLETFEITGMGDRSPYAVPKAITNAGYDFIEKTRDPDVWEKTQLAMTKIGGWTLGTVISVASLCFQEKVKKVVEGVMGQ